MIEHPLPRGHRIERSPERFAAKAFGHQTGVVWPAARADALTAASAPAGCASCGPTERPVLAHDLQLRIRFTGKVRAWLGGDSSTSREVDRDGGGSSGPDRPRGGSGGNDDDDNDNDDFGAPPEAGEPLGCPDLGVFKPPEPFSFQSYHDDSDPYQANEEYFDCSKVIDDIDANWSQCPAPPVGCETCVPDTRSSTSLDISGSTNGTTFTAREEDLVNAAWNFLQLNSDIVEWVICLVEGPANAAQVLDRLFDTSNPQDIIFDSVHPAWSPTPYWTDWLLQDIHIDNTDDGWSNSSGTGRFDRYSQAVTAGDLLAQCCAIAALAGTLMHEMLHGSLSVFNENFDRNNECNTTYMAETAFYWAIGQRYPAIPTEPACSEYALDCAWFNDDSGINCSDLYPPPIVGGEPGGAGGPCGPALEPGQYGGKSGCGEIPPPSSAVLDDRMPSFSFDEGLIFDGAQIWA